MTIALVLSPREIDVLCAAIRACFEEIDDWEFGLRMVVEPDEARAVLCRLAEARHREPPELELTGDELAMCGQSLNEVLHGFKPPDFSVIGTREEADALLDRLLDLRR